MKNIFKKKSRIFFLFLFVIFLSFSSVLAWTDNLYNNLSAYYNFENTTLEQLTVVDSLNNTFNASIVNGIFVYETGKIKKGINASIQGAISVQLNLTRGIFTGDANFSILCWVKTLNGGSATMSVFTMGGADGIYFDLYNGQVSFGRLGSGGSLSGTTINNGSWRMIAGVKSGGTYTDYIDGVQAGTPSNQANTMNIVVNQAWFGDKVNAGGQAFDGRLDECAIYRRALNITEIQYYYNSSNGITLPTASVPLPSVTLNNPLNNSFLNSSSVTFNCSSSGTSIFNLSLYINNVLNYTLTNSSANQNLSIEITKSLSDGIYNYSCGSVNTGGSFLSSAYIFNVTSPPLSLNQTPMNNSNYSSSNPVTFNCTAIGVSLKNVSLYIDGILNYTVINSSVDQLNLSLQKSYLFNLGNHNYFCSAFSTINISGSINYFNINNVSEVLYVNSFFPYVAVNTNYPLVFGVLVDGVLSNVGNFNISINGTSYAMPFYNSSSKYNATLIFSSIGDYPFVIYTNNSNYPNFTGTFYVRNLYYITFCGFKEDTSVYTNNYGYLLFEPSTRVRNPDLETYMPLSSLNKNYYWTEYSSGCGTVQLFDSGRYAVRLIDGNIYFNSSFAPPNIIKSYGHNIYIGEFNFNGSSQSYNFVLSDKDLSPYFWLFNWVAIICVVLVIIISFFVFAKFPETPQSAIVFFVIGVVGIAIIRVIVWLWIG